MVIKSLYFLDYGIEFFSLCPKDYIRIVLADHGLMSGDYHYLQFIDLVELPCLCLGGTSHAGELLIHTEKVLEGYGCQCLVFTLYLYPFFGLEGLVQPITVASPRHKAAREFVNYHYLTVFDYIVHIPLKQGMGLEGLLYIVKEFRLDRVIEVFHV